MPRITRTTRNVILITAGSIILLLALLIIFISPVTKYAIEKYDTKFSGREIQLDWAYVNPFTGYFHLDDFTIREFESDSIFIHTKGLSFRFDIGQLLKGRYEITGLILDEPVAKIIQIDREHANFNSLIEHFTSEDSTADTSSEPVHFRLADVEINDGRIYYIDRFSNIDYFIRNLDFESTGYSTEADSISAEFSFDPGTGSGHVKGDFRMNIDNLNYGLGVAISKLDLKIIEQYLKEMSNYGTFKANIDADIRAQGNFHEAENLTASGFLAINDFHFGKKPGDDYASFTRLALDINELSPVKKVYDFDSIVLTEPFFRYEQYEKLNNIETVFGMKGENIAAEKGNPQKFNLILEIADYIKVLAQNFVRSYYKIGKIAVERGDFVYNDFSLNEKFHIELDPVNITATAIDKNDQRVKVNFASGLKPFGEAGLKLSVNPKDFGEFEMVYSVDKVPAPLFNPYLVTYTSYPLDRGSLALKGTWNLKEGVINSNNHLLVLDPRVAKRIKNKDNTWIPMPLVMALVREYGNVIDYEIPITGNAKNSNLHVHDIVIDLLKNIFIKPVTIPYRMEVRNVETEVEKSYSLKWELQKAEMKPQDARFVEKLADFLEKNPTSSVTVEPKYYADKEKEYLLFFEAKKKYWAATGQPPDSQKTAKLPIRDPGFLAWLSKFQNDSLAFTIQEKCARVAGKKLLAASYAKLNRDREKMFTDYFRARGLQDRVKMKPAEETIPYNGYSFYRIRYSGDRPEELRTAYQELNKLNEEPPREKYKEERARNRWWQLKKGRT